MRTKRTSQVSVFDQFAAHDLSGNANYVHQFDSDPALTPAEKMFNNEFGHPVSECAA